MGAVITRRALRHGCPQCGDTCAWRADVEQHDDGRVRQVWFVRCLACGLTGNVIRRGPWLGGAA